VIILHADWGTDPRKRWIATARSASDGWAIEAIAPWGREGTPLERLGLRDDEPGPILIGLDFPIGLPRAYAERAGITSFRDALLAFGGPGWETFYEVARTPEEISIARPFYPHRPGGTRRQHLANGLGIPLDALWRDCERATPTRPAACPLFWTLGANQAGKGAIAGWQELVAPLVRDGAALWPFDGDLADLLATHRITIAETYPAQYYAALGFGRGWSKRRQADRRDRAACITNGAAALGTAINLPVLNEVTDGFGLASSGEDRFDALVGLVGMLQALRQPTGRRQDAVEGSILGLPQDDRERSLAICDSRKAL
jgi:hypothetical protein